MATKKDKPRATGRSETRQKGSAAFELWLNRGLHQLFDDVASEPVPEDLLKLIEDDKAAH